jgi:Kef-type K+ transport system membrane component KefB
VLFTLLVGLEVDPKPILQQRRVVPVTSHCSILLPLGLGMGIAKTLYPEFATQRVSFSSFALFVGTAISVTAFPVRARILKDGTYCRQTGRNRDFVRCRR